MLFLLHLVVGLLPSSVAGNLGCHGLPPVQDAHMRLYEAIQQLLQTKIAAYKFGVGVASANPSDLVELFLTSKQMLSGHCANGIRG